jgi:hypothetical protein
MNENELKDHGFDPQPGLIRVGSIFNQSCTIIWAQFGNVTYIFEIIGISVCLYCVFLKFFVVTIITIWKQRP